MNDNTTATQFGSGDLSFLQGCVQQIQQTCAPDRTQISASLDAFSGNELNTARLQWFSNYQKIFFPQQA